MSAMGILPALAEERAATAPELADRLGCHPVTVERRCRRLQRAGRVRRIPGGAYTLRRDRSGREGRAASD